MTDKFLYPCFKWPGAIWLYTDPHFNDSEMQYIRKNYIGDDEQIKRINSKVGKHDTIVFLGDIGDVSFIKRIRGYKVLVKGNHDNGASKYQRVVNRITTFNSEEVTPEDKLKILINSGRILSEGPEAVEDLNFGKYFHEKVEDNHLFDEVYPGVLTLNEKIILSHEPIENLQDFLFNIHGHDHSNSDFTTYVLKYYDADMPSSDYLKNYLDVISKENLNRLNICPEWLNYEPINLKSLYKSGVFHNVKDIHRKTIDKASEKKKI